MDSSQRWACLKLTPSTPAADTVVRRPASTSVKTSTRCKSCLLICTQPNLSPPTLISGWGSDTLALQSYDIIIALLLHALLLQSSNGSSVHLVKSYAGFSIAWSYLLFRPFGAL
jgi:hypothetical protein